jgi:hypothetical protein
MYAEDISASEVDVSGLSGSFLLAQVMRFAMVGRMPGYLGSIFMVGEIDMSGGEYAIMYLFGILLLAFSVLCINVKTNFLGNEPNPICRALDIMSITFGMCFGWCIVFGTSLLLKDITGLTGNGHGTESVLGRCFLALVLSILCMMVIWIMSALEGWYEAWMPPGSELRIVSTMSVLLGYAWVSAYSEAIEVVASSSPNPIMIASLIVVVTLFVVLPAWVKHMIQKTMVLEAYNLRKLAGARRGWIDRQA